MAQIGQINSKYALDETTLELTMQKVLGDEVGTLTVGMKQGKELIQDWFNNGREWFNDNQFIPNLQNFNYLHELIKVSKPMIVAMVSEINNARLNIPIAVIPHDIRNYYRRNADIRAIGNGNEDSGVIDIDTTGDQGYRDNTMAANQIDLKAQGNITRKTTQLSTPQTMISNNDININAMGDYSSTGGILKSGNDIKINANSINMDAAREIKVTLNEDKKSRTVNTIPL